ncbi:MAG: Flp pilus assembly protein CpaB [Elusimicrobia bacterium]|nr:Flp pilus assembly protein CpaB [Elusimicrobiota bacterium]
MEKKGFMIPLVLAFAAALFYVMALSRQEKQLGHNYESVNVLVARTDIPERTVLKEELAETATLPRRFMAQDAFEVKTQSDIKLISNLVTRIRIPKGNQITQSALVSLSPEAGLSTKVPPGYRGAVIPVDTDLMQLVKPGDRVDVLVSFDALMADNRKEKVTATILQNVLVLGVGQNLGQGLTAKQFQQKSGVEAQASAFSEKGILSVALNPTEAQYLFLAMGQGSVSVILRGLGDLEMHPMEMASFRKLFR